MEGNLSWRHALAFLVTITSAWLIWNGTHLILTEPDRFAAYAVDARIAGDAAGAARAAEGSAQAAEAGR